MAIFIGPESDHWQCLSLTDSLTDSCLVNLINVSLACEDGNSKLVIRPESDHWLCLSLTDSLTDSCLVNLIDVTLLACEDANSKLVDVVTVADEDRVGNKCVVSFFLLMFCRGYEVESWSRF